MFVDRAQVRAQGGRGGAGCVSFRREKFVPRGGPDGGDGGRGGSVILEVRAGLRTLADVRYRRHFAASDGRPGEGGGRHGRDGEDVVVPVPPGTMVWDQATGRRLADLTEPGQRFVLAKGGRGGRGNARFRSSVHRAPRMAERGEPGEVREVVLELRVLADVGLVGPPNAGKSTLLGHATGAPARVGPYPFTTLEPGLGALRLGDREMVWADLPGLLAGASQGRGLGIQFLQHAQRCRVFLVVVDLSGQEGRDPWQDVLTTLREMEAYDPSLLGRPRLLVANKMDLGEAQVRWPAFRQQALEAGEEPWAVAALTGQGLGPLVARVADLVEAAPDPRTWSQGAGEEEAVFTLEPDEVRVVREGEGAYRVQGRALERRVAMTPLDNEEALERLLGYLRRQGVEERLRAMGARDGDTVRIGEAEFVLTGEGETSPSR
jgi:GTP-binding protein